MLSVCVCVCVCMFACFKCVFVILNAFVAAYQGIGLSLNIKKTKVPLRMPHSLSTKVNGETLTNSYKHGALPIHYPLSQWRNTHKHGATLTNMGHFPIHYPLSQWRNTHKHGATLTNIGHFPFLGSYLSFRADIDTETQHCLPSATHAFRWLRKRVFDDHDIRCDTKTFVYKADIHSTLLYGSEPELHTDST